MKAKSTDAKSLLNVAKRIDQNYTELRRLRAMEKAVGQMLDALEVENRKRDARPGSMEAWLGGAYLSYSRLRATHDGQVQDLGGAEQLGLTPR